MDTRVFYGEHQLILKQNGKTIHTENVSFTQARTATIHLQGTGKFIYEISLNLNWISFSSIRSVSNMFIDHSLSSWKGDTCMERC